MLSTEESYKGNIAIHRIYKCKLNSDNSNTFDKYIKIYEW